MLDGGKTAPPGGITVTYSVDAGSTATAGADYTALSGTATIAENTSAIAVAVNVLDDDIVEASETVTVNLATEDHAGTSIHGTNNSATVTISDDDTTTISITASLPAAGEPGTDGEFTIQLDGGKFAPPGGINVTYALDGGSTATAGADYTALSGSATIAVGTNSITVPVAVLDDTIVEGSESVIVNLTSEDHVGTSIAAGPNNTATVSIADNDATTISISAPTPAASEPGANGEFTIQLDGGKLAPTGGITVTYTVDAGSTATAGADYTALSGTATIAAGDTAIAVPVSVIDDNIVEAAETITVNLATEDHVGTSIHGTNNTATVTISDDDATTISISATTPAAAEPGTDGEFTIQLDGAKVAPPGGITVTYAVDASSSATSVADYAALSGTATILAGTGSITVPVTVADDSIVEESETVGVNLSTENHVGTTIAASPNDAATVTISDDDNTTVSISATDPTATEPGDNGEFTIQLAGGKVAPTGGITVAYAIDGATTATSGTDYVALSGTATITGAASSVTIPVTVVNDDVVEGDETLIIDLVSTDHSGVGIAASPNDTDAVTISDEDSATFAISDAPAGNEDNVGTVARTFFVTLTGDVDQSVTIDFATADGSATVADTDYAANANTLTFAGTNGESIQVDVLSNGDTKVEADETFAVNLSNVQANGKNVTIADAQGIGTIINDDAATLTIADVSQDENSSGTMTFTVELSNTVQGGVSVDFATSNGSAEDQATDGDYTGIPSGTLNFIGNTAGEQIDINVTIGQDDKVEADETFLVTLSNLVHTAEPGQVTMLGSPATGTILNDDTSTLTINPVAVNEGNVVGDNVLLTLNVDLSAAVQGGVSVDYVTGDGSAKTGDGDYNPAGGTINFTGIPASDSSGVIIQIGEDVKIEADETFSLTLSNIVHSAETGSITAGSPGTGTITNDDAMALDIYDVSLAEGSGGGFNSFTFQVDSPLAVQDGYKVAFTVNDNSATDADDFDVATASPITFTGSAGESQFITVNVIKDNVSEDDETFTITLGALSDIPATAADDIDTSDVGNGTIIYDDYEAFMGADITDDEGNLPAENVNLTFTVNLDRPNKSCGDIDVQVTTMDQTAVSTGDSDYTALSGTIVSIPDTEQSETFNVAVTEDVVVENDEVFYVDITGAPANLNAYTLIRPLPQSRAVGTIRNDDAATLAIDDVSWNEGKDGATTTFTFTVTLTGYVDQAFTVDWATQDNSANAGTAVDPKNWTRC